MNRGLRSRVTVAFGLGAALLSVALAVATYSLAHHFLLAQREASAGAQTYADARVMKRELSYAGANLGEALASLSQAQGTVTLLYRRGEWYSASVAVGQSSGAARPASLPAPLVALVTKGVPARQRLVVSGQPAVAIGVPLPAVGADYFEMDPLTELSRTLGLLAGVLFASSIATTLAGLIFGRWASGRLVRPLRSIADVAAAIAGGALDQRLPATNDPDLAVLANTFNEMVGALEERIERDAHFASDVSHELRSPLTTIGASVELLRVSKAPLGADGRRALDLLSVEVERFSTMVQDLLEISRSDAGVCALDLEELLLDELVVSTVAAYTKGRVPVTVKLEAKGTWLLGDRRRLQRVLVNLLQNASVHGGGSTGVEVGRWGGEARLVIDDAGPGVAVEERGLIFQRFYRGAAAGRRSGTTGTGLGLALVEEHLAAHGGRAEVGERPGGGARFIVRLPLVPGTAQAAKGRSSPARSRAHGRRGRRLAGAEVGKTLDEG